MKVLVTGANGLLGQKLSKLLVEDKNILPILTLRKQPYVSPVSVGQHILDITDGRAVHDIFLKFRPDVVVHTAAMTMVDLCEQQKETCWQNNVTGTEHLLRASEATGAHFIYVSTDFIFDGSHGPLDESAQPRPVNFYGESKLAAEELVKKNKTTWAIIRTVLVYGITTDMSRSNIVLWVKENLEKGKPIKVVNDQWRTPTLAEDLAMGCYLAALKKASGIFHVSGKDFMTPYDIAVQTAEYFGLDKKLISPTNSTEFTQPARRPAKTGFVIEKARKELGYEPHSFSEGLDVLSGQIAGRV
jgi:dTDP-4-dehydrorhamnose reductase